MVGEKTDVPDHFREVTKMITLGRGFKREACGRLRESEKRLSQNIYERHVKSKEKKIAEQSGRFPVAGEEKQED